MDQRGKKSGASLAVASVTRLSRMPDAPSNMTPAQADVWKMVIGSRSGDMIDPEAYPLLAEYCRAIVTADQIAEQLNTFDPAWLIGDESESGLRRWDKLTAMQARAQGIIVALSGKLRISPSSRVRADAAGVIANKGPKRKPWERD